MRIKLFLHNEINARAFSALTWLGIRKSIWPVKN